MAQLRDISLWLILRHLSNFSCKAAAIHHCSHYRTYLPMHLEQVLLDTFLLQYFPAWLPQCLLPPPCIVQIFHGHRLLQNPAADSSKVWVRSWNKISLIFWTHGLHDYQIKVCRNLSQRGAESGDVIWHRNEHPILCLLAASSGRLQFLGGQCIDTSGCFYQCCFE